MTFPGRRRTGFTLVEVMLVVVIIGIASAVALPTFAKSYRGAKLRTSVRMVLAMHRNAQSKAVLGQEYTALLFDVRKGTVDKASDNRRHEPCAGTDDGRATERRHQPGHYSHVQQSFADSGTPREGDFGH